MGTSSDSSSPTVSNEPSHLKVKLQLDPGASVDLEIELINQNGEMLETRTYTFTSPEPVTGMDEGAKAVEKNEVAPEPLEDSPASQEIVAEEFLPAEAVEVFEAETPLPAEQLPFGRRVVRTVKGWARDPQVLLLVAAIVVYLIVRFVRLDDFPIYFFTDEAVQTMSAADLVRDGFFYGQNRELLPTYFVNGMQYNLSVSVYVQVIPYLLFGKSIWVTRGVSVLLGLLGAIALGLIYKRIFQSPYPWLPVMILSVTPAWFLHSRTAFETVIATSFFGVFLYFYLMYRQKSPRYLYGAVVAGALCFYSYSPAQVVMGVTALLLIISDARYHWQNRKTILKAFILAVVLALPYFRFLILHGEENVHHLEILSSYWIEDIPLLDKLNQFATEYLNSMSPNYWFTPNDKDISRHVMLGYGNMASVFFPFAMLGIILSLIRFKKPAYRTLIIAMLAAPAGAALVGLGITRILFMVMPLALVSAIGISQALEWIEKLRIPRWILALPLFLGFVVGNVSMLNDALQNGPTWFDDYTLSGMQWGAETIFSEIETYRAENPGTEIILSPAWANGFDVVERFFLDDRTNVVLDTIESYFFERKPLDETMTFIMTPQEYARAIQTGKFTDIHLENMTYYPNGLPGFYWVKLRYVDNFEEVLQQEADARHTLQEGSITLPDGTALNMKYSLLDSGTLYDLFDGNQDTFTRTAEANPMVVEVNLPEARPLTGVNVKLGGVASEVTVYVYPLDGGPATVYRRSIGKNAEPRFLEVPFGTTTQTDHLRIEVLSVEDGEPAHVHVWEIIFEQDE